MRKKTRLQWLAMSILAIFTALLIWQFDYRKESGHPAPHGVTGTLAQNKTAASAIAKAKPCVQKPIQINESDIPSVENTLKCIITAYTDAAGQKDKERILALDIELKELADAVNSIKNHEAWDEYWRGLDKEVPKYEYQTTIGIYIDENGMYYDRRLRNDRVVQSQTGKLPELTGLKPQFDQINSSFMAIPKTPEVANIEALYKLDVQLEKLVAVANGNFDKSSPFPSYPEIGVVKNGGIYYSGAIRLAADKMLPPQGFVDPKTGEKIEVKGDRYTTLKGALEGIYLTYQSLRQVPEDAEKLYELSEQLDKLVGEIHKAYPNSRSQIFWEDKYEPLGLYIGHYSDQLDYGGKLVVESYKLNPNSRYREATLVAAISGAGDMSELSGIPDMGLAELYLKKYPDGKYLKTVYSIIATFYQNLYEELLAGDKSEVILGCYNDYLAAHPEDKDREVVRIKAITYYKKLLAFEPAQDGYKKALSNLENGIDGHTRYWCTD